MVGEVGVDPATLLRPAGDDLLKVWPVSKQVNSPRNNGAELLETISPANLPCVDRLGPREP